MRDFSPPDFSQGFFHSVLPQCPQTQASFLGLCPYHRPQDTSSPPYRPTAYQPTTLLTSAPSRPPPLTWFSAFSLVDYSPVGRAGPQVTSYEPRGGRALSEGQSACSSPSPRTRIIWHHTSSPSAFIAENAHLPENTCTPTQRHMPGRDADQPAARSPPQGGPCQGTGHSCPHPGGRLLPTFLMPSEALATQLSAPPFLLMVRQSSANVLSCSRGLVPLARKYSYTAESRTVPYDSSTCWDRSWNVLKGKKGVNHGSRLPAAGHTWAVQPS